MASDNKEEESGLHCATERKSLPYEPRPRDDWRPFRSDWRLAVIEGIVYVILLGVVGLVFFYLLLWWHGVR